MRKPMNELATVSQSFAMTQDQDLDLLMKRMDAETKIMDFDSQISEKLAQSSMIPKAFVGKPHDCFSAIQYGRRFGFDPMTSLQNMHVINGSPSFSAQAVMGIVLKYADCPPRIEYTEDKGIPITCTVTYTRKGVEYSESFGLEDAKKANIINNVGWKNYPKNMMTWRAAVFAARKAFPDVLAGVYTDDELKDMKEVKDVTPPPPTAPKPQGKTPQQLLLEKASADETTFFDDINFNDGKTREQITDDVFYEFAQQLEHCDSTENLSQIKSDLSKAKSDFTEEQIQHLSSLFKSVENSLRLQQPPTA